MATPTKVPTRKVVAGGATGALVTLIVWGLNTYVPLFKAQPITGEVASLAATVLAAFAAWVAPPATYETTETVDGHVRTATDYEKPQTRHQKPVGAH